MKTPPRRHPAAFTLIELMAVITIIVILAGLVVGGLGFVNERQAREQAKTQIALLEKAIQEYHLDMGRYPGTGTTSGGNATSAAGDHSQMLYTALFYDGWDYDRKNQPDNWTKATKIYLPELDPTSNRMGWTSATGTTPPASTKVNDPWGNPYRYRSGGSALQNPDFDLWSNGKDNRHNTSNLGHRDNRDDIRNF